MSSSSEFSGPAMPKKGARLLGGANDWKQNARLGYLDIEMCWDAYAEGFKTAADQLVQDLLDNRVWPIDVLLYPVAFLYRQYLELRLKELIVVSGRLLGLSREVPIHHDLMSLWKDVRPRLEQIWFSRSNKMDNDAIEDGLHQFCDADPGSYSFRYPVDRHGNPV
ncbi:MAG: hypothetical protein MUP15_10635, partial [Dehalococcoidia bacterium]|nr:hypothetical protein [Dehalococcoidia bacterium]